MEITLGNSPSNGRQTLLTLCGLFLAVLLPFSTVVIAVETVLFQPEPLLEALEQNNFYHDYPMLMLAFSSAGGDLMSPGLGTWLSQNMAQGGVVSALGFIFPEPWVRDQTEQNIQKFYAYANFNSSSLDIGLDLTPVKLRLTGGTGRSLIENTLNAWPACTLEDAVAIAGPLLKGQVAGLPHCKPPDELMPAYLNILQLGMDTVAAGLPNRIRLLPVQTTLAGGIYAILRWALRIAPLAFLLILLVSFFLLGWSIRAMLSWIGLPLYAGGLLAVIFAGLAGGFAAWALPLPLTTLPPPVALLAGFAIGVFLVVWREFLLTWAIISALIAFLGLFFILYSSFLSRKRKEVK
jgi:hypothetical protein